MGNQLFNTTSVPNFFYRAAMSYVTGTHNFKAGFNRVHGYLEVHNYDFQPTTYRFNNGVPNQITLRASPYTTRAHQDNDLGLFAQDRWTLDRWTLSGGVRFDLFQTSFPEQHIGPGPLVPTRNITFPAQENMNWKDITYRSAAAWDIFGDGRTAFKITLNKYLAGQTLNALGVQVNPFNQLINTTNRSWNDRGGLGINGDYIPQCNLSIPAANGECGPLASSAFGTAIPGASFDPDLLGGFGNRQYNWEFSAGVQHELMPRVSLDVGYFRRIWGNFQVTDNLALSAADFDLFSMTAPRHPELPGGGGFTVDGLRNLKPTAFGRPAQDLNTLSDKYGKQIEHWNGFDITVNARLQNGLTMQAGTSTGRTSEDDCEIVAKLPEMNSGANLRPLGYCNRETPWQTQFKGYAVYTVPRVDVQLSGTLRSTIGNQYNANFTATNAILASSSTLGRPLAGNAANIWIALLAPNSTFIERRNELDLRFGKILRFGRVRNVVSLDLFNALNSDALVSLNQSFASWLRPTEILNARLMKISYTLDF